MPGIGSAPIIGIPIPGPIAQSAIWHLEIAQTVDGSLYVLLNFLLFIKSDVQYIAQKQLWEGCGGGLFHTSVGITEQIIHPFGKIHGRKR